MENEKTKRELDAIDEYVYDLDKFETYEELVSALRADERFDYEPGDSYYLELATDIISRGEGYVCDLCSHIFPLDDAFAIDYADPDDENNMKILKELEDMEDGENVAIICQDCYRKLLSWGKEKKS